jgi:hypothetical protein
MYHWNIIKVTVHFENSPVRYCIKYHYNKDYSIQNPKVKKFTYFTNNRPQSASAANGPNIFNP